MKNIYKTLLFFILIASGLCASAQAYRTDQKMSDQLKNGTVPGQQYAPVSRELQPRKAQAVPTTAKEGYSTQLKKGTLPGMKFAHGGSTAKATKATAKSRANVTTASSSAAKKTVAVKRVAPPVPSQGETAPAKGN